MSKRSSQTQSTTTSSTKKRPRKSISKGTTLLQPVRRPRLTTCTSLSDAITCLQSAQNIMVLVGAGISVSCGVPDFRSENGLYALAQKLGLQLNDPQELFDIHFFDDDEGIQFYKFAHALWPRENIVPSPTHRFLSALDREGRLLRVYTQNIDGLERKAKISATRIVECHGTLLTATCRGNGHNESSGSSKRTACHAVCAAADLSADVEAHQVPRCRRCGGVWKPDVTFFGEPLVASVGKTLEKDRNKVDLLLVIGTSLQVAPISKVMGWLPHDIPQILINMDVVTPPRATSDGFDVSLIGEADVVVAHLAAAMDITIVLPTSMTSTTSTTIKYDVPTATIKARTPDAVIPRGAVWAPCTSQNVENGQRFVDETVRLLQKDAADLITITTVTCDVCAAVVVGNNEVWTCQGCFGYDLCGKCHRTGEAEQHSNQYLKQASSGANHVFVLETRS